MNVGNKSNLEFIRFNFLLRRVPHELTACSMLLAVQTTIICTEVKMSKSELRYFRGLLSNLGVCVSC